MREALTTIRYAQIAASEVYPGGPEALGKHRSVLEQGLQRGEVQVWPPSGDPQAFVLHWFEHSPFYDREVTNLVVHRRPVPGSLDWVRAVLTPLVPALEGEVVCAIPAGDPDLRDLLVQQGLAISSVILAGRAEQALNQLVARRDPPRSLDAQGLALVPLEPVHADALVTLWQRIFSAEPQHCWFGTRPAVMARFRTRLLSPAPGHRLVALRGEEVVGFFAADFNQEGSTSCWMPA